jgi:hypothetical protein
MRLLDNGSLRHAPLAKKVLYAAIDKPCGIFDLKVWFFKNNLQHGFQSGVEDKKSSLAKCLSKLEQKYSRKSVLAGIVFSVYFCIAKRKARIMVLQRS